MPHRWRLVHPGKTQWQVADDYWECQNCHAGYAVWKSESEPSSGSLVSIPIGREVFFAKKKPHLLHSECYLVQTGLPSDCSPNREYLTCEEFIVRLVSKL